ncbi:hypothetical protein [Streptomyces hirsutus]|uniref:hypothetical protein n=1 Tax=Streptomyces hirsutus TaxID=35620 RepID=UPI00364A60E2
MARVWTCGFELQSVTPGVEIQTVTGTPTISTTIRRAGAAALRINPAAATQYVEQQLDSGTVKRTFHRLYLRVTTLPSADVTVYGIGQSGYFPGLLRLTTTGTLVLRDGFTSTNIGTTSAPLVTGRWYRVELDYTDTAGPAGSVTGAFRAYIDGALFSDTLCSNINGWSRIRIGAQNAVSTDFHVDDVAVNDVAGTVQNALPGPGNVVHLRPDSAGDANGFATAVGGTAGAANNHTRVAEVTPDDATSYVETTAAGTTTIDDYNLSSPATAGIGADDTITLVHVCGRIGSTAATAATLVYRLKAQAAGTTSESASVSVALAGWATNKAAAPYVPQLTSYADPQTGAAWTRAALDAAQIGVRTNVSQATIRRVSALWALVEYVPRTVIALPTVTETNTAQALVPTHIPAGIPVGLLQDDFTDDTVDPAKWPETYGGCTETGGRATVPCTLGYAAYSSAKAYSLVGTQASCRLYPAAADGAVGEAWSQLLVTTTTLGTDAMIEVNTAAGELHAALRTAPDYADPGFVSLPYDPVAHAWVRIIEAAGQLRWQTAPDGATWTTRRTEMTPAWASETSLQVQLIAHRDAGGPNEAQFDDFNVLPASATLPTVAETASAQPLTAHKTLLLPTVAETGSAQPLTGHKAVPVPTATETGSVRLLTGQKTGSLAPVGESSAAQSLTGTKSRPLPALGESNTAQTLTGHRETSLPTVQEALTARFLTPHKAPELPAASETASARPLTATKAAQLPRTAAQDAPQPLTAAKTPPLPRASEIDTVQPLTPAGGLPTVYETATARPLTAHKALTLPTAYETSSARPLSPTKARPLAAVGATATVQAFIGRKGRALLTVHETSTARPFTHGTPSDPVEVDYEVGQPFTTWTAGQPHANWETGQPW